MSDEKISIYLSAAVILLPDANRDLLRWLIGFFVDLATYSPVNKITHSNIATVIGPNIMRQKDESPFDLVTNAPVVNCVCMSLLRFYGQEPLADPSLPGNIPFKAIARIVYPFEGSLEEDQLTLIGDEIVYVTNYDDNEWWEGETRGQWGYFPGNYVKVLFQYQVAERREIEKSCEKVDDHGDCRALIEELRSELYLEKERRADLEATLMSLQSQLKSLEERGGKVIFPREDGNDQNDENDQINENVQVSSNSALQETTASSNSALRKTTFKPSRSKSLGASHKTPRSSLSSSSQGPTFPLLSLLKKS